MKIPKSKAQYIDRTLLKHHFKIILCKSEKDFYLELTKAHAHLKDYPEWLSYDAFAMTHTYIHPIEDKDKKKKKYIFVCIKPRQKNYVSCLIHEAVHVWWREVEWIQEENPSEEVECYAIASIASGLIEAYKK